MRFVLTLAALLAASGASAGVMEDRDYDFCRSYALRPHSRGFDDCLKLARNIREQAFYMRYTTVYCERYANARFCREY
ncbi:MAG: hypothetical protein KGL46_06625 [Hyphomicrobiales bacterium]|nr:hypothetical protein [Hyphomicrobiales bacterium]